MGLASRLFKGDRVIWGVFMFLCLISIVEVFSASSTLAYKSDNYWNPISAHASFLLAGFIGILLLHNLPYKAFVAVGALGLPVAMVLIILTFVPGVGVEINGELRWLSFFGLFTFQPSEVAKICAVCYMALVLSRREMFTEKQMFWGILVGVGITFALIFSTNGSTALLLFGVMVMMMFIGQIAFKRIARLLGLCIGSVALLFSVLYFSPQAVVDHLPDRFGTWKNRIERFVNKSDRLDVSDGKTLKLDDEHYQEDLARIAIAQGGVYGKLPGHGQQRDFLPQAYSDFIYAIIIEETGLIGGFFVLFLYIVLMIRVAMIARKCDRLFPKYLILGCGLMIVTQALVNMAVAVGVLPVTGQPLPLISRGGTSTIISCFYIGIILSVSRFGANIGNEADDFPEEEQPEAETALVGVSQEEINNWVPGLEASVPESPTNAPKPNGKTSDF